MAAPARPDGPLSRVLSRLTNVKGNGKQWESKCPAHKDGNPSLSISTGDDGRALLFCHAGCEPSAICSAIGLKVTDLFPLKAPASMLPIPIEKPALTTPTKVVATYDYHDEHGTLLYQVVRGEPKTFRQRKPDGNGGWIWSIGDTRRVLYRLPEILEAVALGHDIYIVEGEKDVGNLVEYGFAATTNPGGAGKWRDEFSDALAGANVVILPDNDEPGKMHAEAVAESLVAKGCRVKVVELPGLPPKGDVSDFPDYDELRQIVANTPFRSGDKYTDNIHRLDELWMRDDLMRPPPCVVPYFAFASRSTLFAAEEKSGKSTTIAAMAAAVSSGGEFLGGTCKQGPVLIVGLEEYVGDVAQRLQRFKGEPQHIYLVARLLGTPGERAAEIAQYVARVKPVLVVVDTLMAYGEGAITDANASSQMQPVVQGLTRIAHESGAALILVHHARKSDGRYRDSSAIGGGVDAIIEMSIPDPDADPTLRSLRARGRIPVKGTRFRLSGNAFTLESVLAPLDARILQCVQNHPGATCNLIADLVVGQRSGTLSEIQRLLGTGALRHDGTGRGMKLYVPAATLI